MPVISISPVWNGESRQLAKEALGAGPCWIQTDTVCPAAFMGYAVNVLGLAVLAGGVLLSLLHAAIRVRIMSATTMRDNALFAIFKFLLVIL